ncbi:restriction endonuclease subunit S [Leptospira interrogans]
MSVAEAICKQRGKELRKLQTAAYQKTGVLPIVDQGAALVCGFTDDTSFEYPHELPVVIFGDHTRVLKYVDFPFAVGADGTQCLRPNENFDPRYFFYALGALELPSEGYARHFKLLKERRIPVPTLDEQRRIAEVLRSVDEAIATEQAYLEHGPQLCGIIPDQEIRAAGSSVAKR